jgi:tetratricopeptide (TPR) repeat protein
MADPASFVAAGIRFAQDARELLKALDVALEHDEPEDARRALRSFLETTGATIDGLRQSPTPVAPPPLRSAERMTDDPEGAMRRWVRSYANLLSEWQLAEAERLIATPPPDVPPRLARAPGLLRAGTRAVLAGRHVDAREMIIFLTKARDGSPGRSHLVSTPIRARLLVYLARIAIFIDQDSEQGFERLAKGGRLSPEDGTVHAGIGSHRRHSGDAASAQAAYQHAIALEPDRPDGYVGMGLLAEDDGRHNDAADWYDRALTVAEGRGDVGRALHRLLAPNPASLLLRWAGRLLDEKPAQALSVLDEALGALTPWESDTASRIQRTRGEILRRLGRRSEAADAYHAAATIAAAPDEYRADLLEQAVALDAQHQAAHWELSEILRLRSFDVEHLDDQRGSVDRGIRLWTHAYEVAPPDPDLTWVYQTRALLSERLADLRAGDRFRLYWEAVGWLERALLSDDDAYCWLHLARMYYSLDLATNALEASARAVERDAENADVATQRALILLATGDYDMAEETLTEARDRTNSAYLDELLVWLYAETDRAREAVELIEPLIVASAEDRDLVSLLDLRAKCYRRLGDTAAEAADADSILAAYRADVPGDERAYARAQTVLGLARQERARLEKALAVLEPLEKDRFENDAALLGQLGVVQLSLGDLEKGRRLTHEALERSQRASEQDEIVDGLELLAESAPASLHEVVRRLRVDADRAREIARPLSAQKEIESVLDTPGIEVAAGLALNRLQREACDWTAAVPTRRGLSEALRESEYRALVQQTVQELLEDADNRIRAGDFKDAYSRLEAASAALTEKDLPSLEGELLARFVAVRANEGDYQRASESLAAAVQRFTNAGSPDPLMDCWEACAGLMPGSAEVWKLDELAHSLHCASNREGEARTLAIVRHLPALEGLDALDEPVHDPRAVVHLGEALIPVDTGPSWPLLATYMPEMRERVRRLTGVSVPGARFRVGWDLAPAEYQIVLAGLSGERALVPSGAFDADKDPVWFVVESLETFLQRNLATLVSAAEVIAMVADEFAYDAIGDLLPSRLDKLRLARVVRALVSDRVPLRDWGAIVKASQAGGAATATALAAARREMWVHLPGNEQHRVRRPLPPDLESRIAGSFEIAGEAVALVGSPIDAVALEQALSSWIERDGVDIAVVTDSHELRLIVQRLTRRHHPDVPILALEETAEVMVADPTTPEEMHAG